MPSVRSFLFHFSKADDFDACTPDCNNKNGGKTSSIFGYGKKQQSKNDCKLLLCIP